MILVPIADPTASEAPAAIGHEGWPLGGRGASERDSIGVKDGRSYGLSYIT